MTTYKNYLVTCLMTRVEPKGASHIFYVHGVSCYTDEHERCKTPVGNERQGKIIPVDVREMRKEEFRVRTHSVNTMPGMPC